MRLRQRIVGWTGWRRVAPACGSVVVNAIALSVVMTGLTAGGTETSRQRAAPRPAIAVTLISETPPPKPQPRKAAPVESRSAPPPAETSPRSPANFVPAKRKTETPSAGSHAPTAENEDGVYIGPPGVDQGGPPLGLRGLLKKDPCNNLMEKLRGDCDLKWGKLLAEGEVVQEPSIEQLKRMYPGFVDEPSCGSSHMGCLEADWRSLNGTRPFPRGPASGGPAGLGGPASGVGRLPPPNEYHRDPGFGD